MTMQFQTLINALLERCFDLARNIDLHHKSMQSSQEEVIAWRKAGLINLGETVTWKAKHFGINFIMEVKVTKMKFPEYFVDEMISGPFKKLRHQHLFKAIGTQTHMTDVFEFTAPAGILGKSSPG